MSEVLVVGIISGVLGVAAAAIPAAIAQRKAPSRRISDTTLILDASGKVVLTLREELDRLDRELEEARQEAARLKKEIESRPTKAELNAQIERLEQHLRALGWDPQTLTKETT